MIVTDHEALSRQSDALVAQIKPILAGHDPGVQGAAIAELFALWVAGHPASVRRQLFNMHCDAVAELYPVVAKQIWKGRGMS